MELVGLDIAVKQQIYKLASISLCPNIAGQVVVDLMVRPPKPGDDSHDQFQRETQATFESLKKRAGLLATALNQLEGYVSAETATATLNVLSAATLHACWSSTGAGVTCNPAEGAMYLFPRIRLPQRAIDEAKRLCRAPDVFYCFALLDATGTLLPPVCPRSLKIDTHHRTRTRTRTRPTAHAHAPGICVVPGSGFGQRDGTFHFRTTFLPQEEQIRSVVDAMAAFHARFMDQWRE
jgi:alanine transaminase